MKSTDNDIEAKATELTSKTSAKIKLILLYLLLPIMASVALGAAVFFGLSVSEKWI